LINLDKISGKNCLTTEIEIKISSDLPQEYILELPLIMNPLAGVYYLKVSTTKEPDFVFSKNYNIIAPLPITSTSFP